MSDDTAVQPPDTVPCRVCPRPVELHLDHVTLAVQVEREAAGDVVVIESRAVGFLHLECVTRTPAGELEEPSRA